MFQKPTEAKVIQNTGGNRLLISSAGPSVPGEVVEKAQDILQGVIPSSLVATALGGSGKVVGEETGHLPGQP